MHTRMLREMVNALARRLLISSEDHSNWEVPDKREKPNITRSFEQGKKESSVKYSLPKATSVPGKVREHILTAIVAMHLKDNKGTASRGFQRAQHT